jgi:hypothetical protein
VPIPFHDADEIEELGSAGYLALEHAPDGSGCRGGLLVVNARGEPLEFAYNQVQAPARFLWRPADLRRALERRLTASLLSVCSHQPRLLLCRAEDVGSALFSLDIHLDVPVARMDEPMAVARRVDRETGEVFEDAAPQVAWQPEPPAEGSLERRLFERLSAHGLLEEPFERAAVGLREVFEAAGAA